MVKTIVKIHAIISETAPFLVAWREVCPAPCSRGTESVASCGSRGTEPTVAG